LNPQTINYQITLKHGNTETLKGIAPNYQYGSRQLTITIQFIFSSPVQWGNFKSYLGLLDSFTSPPKNNKVNNIFKLVWGDRIQKNLIISGINFIESKWVRGIPSFITGSMILQETAISTATNSTNNKTPSENKITTNTTQNGANTTGTNGNNTTSDRVYKDIIYTRPQ
jgi:hypothetical protein